jgi:hypothetical protein
MKRNILIISTIIVILVVILIIAYPSFFILKPYAHSGGFAGLPQDKICECSGISYSYYPDGCNDCSTTYYCIGSLHDCKCFDEQKANEYRKAFDNGEFTGNYWDKFEEQSYSKCD